MERPTSDKILFINSDILIHLMPSKCGILNPGISHGISHSFLQRAQPRNMSQAPTGSQYFPNTLQTYLGVLCGCVVCGWWLPICVALWLLALCVVASLRSCHCAALCARALCGRHTRQSRSRAAITDPYPASEEIDRRPLISCRGNR